MTNRKVAIVTGASRGIGLAAAIKLAEKGMAVVLCSRDQSAIERIRDELQAQFDTPIIGIRADVSNADDTRKLFEHVYEQFQRIDICVNNAGTLLQKSFIDFEDHEWWQEFNNNFASTYHCCKNAFHYMSKTNELTFIVNISSLSGIRFVEKFPNMSAYIASKHAVVGLTESLAVEGKRYNIHTNCVAPGAVDTPMFHDNFADFKPGASAEEIARIITLFCDPEQLGNNNGTTFEVFCNE